MTVSASFSHHCSACGKCCNSPPSMTMPELFRHQSLFLGCLAISRVRRHRAGDDIGADGHRLDDEDARDIDALQKRLHHGADGLPRYRIATQGLDYASSDRCPALDAAGLCTLHRAGKPLMCSSVPLDAQLPDRLQHGVLTHRRASSAYIGADCIAAGARPGYGGLVRGIRVVDAGYAESLRLQREALAAERERWGNAVYGLLRRELFDDPVQQARIPFDGFLALPLTPVLAALADEGEAMRLRCIGYLDSQLALIEDMLARALRRKLPADRAMTAQLRAFAKAYQDQRASFARDRARPADAAAQSLHG